MKTNFKNQRSQFAYMSVACLLLSSRVVELASWINLLYLAIVLWAVGVFLYKVIQKQEIRLYGFLGLAFPTLFVVANYLTLSFEPSLYILWALLFLSMLCCMYSCKDEDAKAIALLHVMYMTSCALAIPIWLKP